MVRIFRHEPPDDPPPILHGDPERITPIEDHVEATLGPIETVFQRRVLPARRRDGLQLAHGSDALLDLWEDQPDNAPTEAVEKDRPTPIP